MKSIILTIVFLLYLPILVIAQEIECEVTFTNVESLPSEARDNLTDFIPQVRQYINSYHWSGEDLGTERIKCAITVSFQGSPRDNHYAVQAFIGSQRPIYKLGRNTAVVRILDDKWEFDYVRSQPFIHDESRFDPLLSFIDFYMYIILGYDFDTYKAGDGTPYFQKASEIINLARTSGGKGWDQSASQTLYSRNQLVDEFLNSKFRDFREAVYTYHYRGIDLLYKNEARARKNVFSALEKIAKLQDKINQRSLIIKTFFDTKYLEIADLFLKGPDLTIYTRLSKIDPAHQKTYDEYSQKPR